MTLEEILKKVRAIEIAQKKRAKNKLLGDYRSAFKGSGMQFKEFRNYVYGDDVRHISWNVSARTQDPILKTFEEERERTLFLIVDVSSSLRRGPWALEKSYKLAEVAATLCLTAFESRDKLGLILFSDKIEQVVPPKNGKGHLLRIIRDVLAFEPQGQKTAPDLALKTALGVLKKKSMVFFLSDLEIIPSENLLRRMASKHIFGVVQTEHPFEVKPQAFPGFIELETSEQKRPVTIDASHEKFLNFLSTFHQGRNKEITQYFKRCGIQFLHLTTEQDSVEVLSKFFKQNRGSNSPTTEVRS
jgi:hypothetical protein